MQGITIKIVVVLCLFFNIRTKAQNGGPLPTRQITSYHIMVGYSKTSNIIFPYAVKSVDRGSADILVQKAKSVENILQVKAAKQGFGQTNISVVTSDGKFYSFLVDYTDDPQTLNISFTQDSSSTEQKEGSRILMGDDMNEADFDKVAATIGHLPTFLHKQTSEQKISLSLDVIFIKDGYMWFVLDLNNNSLIGYQPDYIRFYISDKRKAKRTAVQENELQPLFNNAGASILGKHSAKMLLAFKSFTMPKTKELVIQINEQNGGRSLQLHIGHKALLKARPVKM